MFEQSNWGVFDRDSLPESVADRLRDPRAWWAEMAIAMPALDGVTVTVVPSTTGRVILPDGSRAFGGLGLHAWVKLENGPRKQTDVVALKRQMEDLSELAGLGKREGTDKGGSHFVGLFDPSNWSTERPCFDGAPDLGPGLTLAPPEVFTIHGTGGAFDPNCLPAVTESDAEKIRLARRSRVRKVMRASGVSGDATVTRTGHVEVGFGPRWIRCLNAIGTLGDRCYHMATHAISVALKDGLTPDEIMAEIDRRIAEAPGALGTNTVVRDKLTGYRDVLADFAASIAQREGQRRKRLPRFAGAWPRVFDPFGELTFDDVPTLINVEMGLGKTEAALRLIGKDLRRLGGTALAPTRDGGHKIGAAYLFVPTIDLAEEIADRAVRLDPGLRPYVLRGRAQRNPRTLAKRMCAKKIRETTETARDDGTTALCGPKANRCSAYAGCPYILQVDQLLAMRANLVVLTHASLWTTPPGGDRLPDPLMVVIDEEPILTSGLRNTRRYFGADYPIGLTTDHVRVAAELIEERTITATARKVADLEQELAALCEDGEHRVQVAEDLLLPTRAQFDLWDALGRARAALREARKAVVALRRLSDWIKSRTEARHVLRGDVDGWQAVEWPGVARALRSAIRPTVRPQDWKVTEAQKAEAERSHYLRQVEDFVSHRIVPFVRDGPVDQDAPMPGADLEIDQVRMPDGAVVDVPILRFAWLAPLLARWRDVPTLILDGTGDASIYEPTWPGLSAPTRRTVPWKGRVFWVNCGTGFSKSGLTKRSAVMVKGEWEEATVLTDRGIEVRSFAAFVARYAGGETSMVTHQAMEDAHDFEFPGAVHHHGAIRGLNSMSGNAAHIVVGRQVPQPIHMERAAEALFNRPVPRLKPRPGKTSADWPRVETLCGTRRVLVPQHPDATVSAVFDQTRVGGLAQAAHRSRPVRHPTDVFVLGAEMDFVAEAAPIENLDWQEVGMNAVDRMLGERGIAFGGAHARRLFSWLPARTAERLGGDLSRDTWLMRWAVSHGAVIVRGHARPADAAPGGKSGRFVALLKRGEERVDFQSVGLVEMGKRAGVRQRRTG